MSPLFRPAREKRGDDPLLNIKVAIFCLGAGTALVGMATDTRWIVTLATGILLVGFLLRFLPRRKSDDQEPG